MFSCKLAGNLTCLQETLHPLPLGGGGWLAMQRLQQQVAAGAGRGGGVLLCVRACCCERVRPRAGLQQLRLLSSWSGMWTAVTNRLYCSVGCSCNCYAAAGATTGFHVLHGY
jgi:hypothetical protein